MRRRDREVTKVEDQLSILNDCKVCRIAVQDAQGLYIVPLNFGYSYEQGHLTLYFHSAASGRKISAIEKNGAIAFEMDCRHRLIVAETACGYGYAFGSIIGNGTASIVWDTQEKQRALSLLMKHQTGREFVFDSRSADAVTVLKMEVTAFSVKERR
ncbi:MAG: pyridoxamine 5'-phosphate oxidase family protein [Oscillospiraceae bacterium]|nr:pyridoxamine 5'-phosphate oxidase family protein [Oscillospiraceae bacterium]